MATARAFLFVSLAFCGNFAALTQASEFLKAAPHAVRERISQMDIAGTFVDEIEESLGSKSITGRFAELEAVLRPVFASLPKNEHGRLGHAAVRYTLHRLFVKRHGWSIKGLNLAGGMWNSSSPTGVLKDHVPAYVHGLFEQRLGGKGFGLHELTALAATIEHLIHAESRDKLTHVYKVLDISTDSPVNTTRAEDMLNLFLMAYILGGTLTGYDPSQEKELLAIMPEVFSDWLDTKEFMKGLLQDFIGKDQPTIDFTSLAKIVQQFIMQHGSFQQKGCRKLKASLMNMDYFGTGRVKLSDFYRSAFDGGWTFQESVGYLRQIGALDEADTSSPSVILVNYLTSQANCIAASGFYSVCCKDECEDLLGHIEEHIGSHEAKPDALAALVSSLPSSSVIAPRQLSATLLVRLHGIAAQHGGAVPIHGRLFAQWLHHAYPRECPFPHISGTTNASQDAQEFTALTGVADIADGDEISQYVTDAQVSRISPQRHLESEELMHWSSEEELFVFATPSGSWEVWDYVSPIPAARGAALCVFSCSLAFTFLQTFKILPSGVGKINNEKRLV